MTLAMPDSVTVAKLPPGYDAYLGYIDGDFNTAAALRAKFPGAQLVLLTVTGGTTAADGCDVEIGDLTVAGGVAWAVRKLGAAPASRPVLYASVASMQYVLNELSINRISRPAVRLLSAHWGAGPHICGPGSCGEVSTEMDGTQWTNGFSRPDGQEDFDMSMLADDFFGQPTETEALVQQLGTVQQGMAGNAVRTVQGLCNAREGAPITPLVIDGVFGPATAQMVKGLQQAAKLTADGVVGPLTWPVLLGIA